MAGPQRTWKLSSGFWVVRSELRDDATAHGVAFERVVRGRFVILEDPAFFPMPESLNDVLGGFRTFMTGLQNRTKEQLLSTVGAGHPGWSHAEHDAWAESKLQFTPRIVETLCDLPDVAALFPRIGAPVLILKADAPPEERRRHLEAAAALPHGGLVHIEGAGHSVHRDKPAETLAAIREFLSGLQ